MLLLRVKLLSILLLLLICGNAFVCGDEVGRGKKLHSQFVAGVFHDIGYEILNSRGADDAEVEEAMVFLVAALELDGQSSEINETILKTSSLVGDAKYDKWILRAFEGYCGRDADLAVAGQAAMHFLKAADSGKERQEILSQLLSKVGDRNLTLNSHLSTRLGFLLAGRGDYNSTAEAHSYFRKAVQYDPYNQVAFSSLHKLFSSANKQIPPSMRARQLRFSMTANPMDLDSVFQFAQYTGDFGMYDISCRMYKYWVKLHYYLNGDSAFDPSIYLPWAFSNYCSEDGQKECLKILEIARGNGIFDMMLESIALKAAFKMSDKAVGEQILASIEDKINSSGNEFSDVDTLQAAWFYNFISPDPVKAMKWANKAYSIDPNSADTKAMLGFSLVADSVSQADEKSKLQRAEVFFEEKQGQGKSYDKHLYQVSQIAAVGMGIVELRKGDSKKATEILQLAVRMSENSFVAEKAKELLKGLSAEYKTMDYSGEIIKSLKLSFPDGIVPKFVRQEDIISAKLAIANTEISFGTEPEVKLLISNKSSESLVISDKGLFKGNIRVDAEVSGDIKTKIFKLITKKIRPGLPVNAGRYLSVDLNVMTGNLRQILEDNPQASVEIKFTVYLDPVVDKEGKVTRFLKGVDPIIKKLTRPGVRINNKYLIRSLTELSKGRFKQKIRSGQLFAGLFNEQHTKTGARGKYRFVPVKRSLLTGSIRKNIADDDWMVKTAGMCNLLDFRPPVDFAITKAVSTNLNDSKWPVRMAALYMLSRTQGDKFLPILEWKAKNDPDLNVRRLAEVLVKRQ